MSTILSFPDPSEYGGPGSDPYDDLPIWDSHADPYNGWSSPAGWEPSVSSDERRYPTSSNPDQVVHADGSVTCAIWCREGDDHPYAVCETERICVSPQLRLIPEQGGGRSAHTRPAGCRCNVPADCPAVDIADAAVSCVAEEFPGEPAAIVLATEVAGVEQHVTLTIDETDEVAADLLTLAMRIEGVRD